MRVGMKAALKEQRADEAELRFERVEAGECAGFKERWRTKAVVGARRLPSGGVMVMVEWPNPAHVYSEVRLIDLTTEPGDTDSPSKIDVIVKSEISKFETLTLDIGTQVSCNARSLCRSTTPASPHVPQSLVTAAPATVSVPRASHSQGLKHEYYYGSVRFNTRKFWADYRKSLPLHYAVYLAEVACKRAAAANVESVFSGAGKFTDEASSAQATCCCAAW